MALYLKKHKKTLTVASRSGASVTGDHTQGNSQNVSAAASGFVLGGSGHRGTCKSAFHHGGSTSGS